MFYKETSFTSTFIRLMSECNDIILDIYNSEFDVAIKDDKSPLTIADEECNKHICNYLQLLTQRFEENGDVEYGDMIVISEENKNMDYDRRKNKKWCWLVDPVDGTKEFVKKNGQFTVNIGLCEDGVPVFGIVSIPVSGEIYYGINGIGSFKLNENEETKKLKIRPNKTCKGAGVKIIASASHLSKKTEEFIRDFENPEIINVGSSIKLLWVAENKADLYPRIAPTSEWDTCAAHAVVKYAGGSVVQYDNYIELQYNKECLLNPFFICK